MARAGRTRDRQGSVRVEQSEPSSAGGPVGVDQTEPRRPGGALQVEHSRSNALGRTLQVDQSGSGVDAQSARARRTNSTSTGHPLMIRPANRGVADRFPCGDRHLGPAVHRAPARDRRSRSGPRASASASRWSPTRRGPQAPRARRTSPPGRSSPRTAPPGRALRAPPRRSRRGRMRCRASACRPRPGARPGIRAEAGFRSAPGSRRARRARCSSGCPTDGTSAARLAPRPRALRPIHGRSTRGRGSERPPGGPRPRARHPR